MAQARATRPKVAYDKKLTHVPTGALTWKTVILVWLLCVTPIMAGSTYVLYTLYPQPFKAAWALSVKGATTGKAWYDGWQAQRTAERKKAEAEAKKAADAAAAGDAAF